MIALAIYTEGITHQHCSRHPVQLDDQVRKVARRV
jgi:hypothetical protein